MSQWEAAIVLVDFVAYVLLLCGSFHDREQVFRVCVERGFPGVLKSPLAGPSPSHQ
jgi:hypothetical protein